MVCLPSQKRLRFAWEFDDAFGQRMKFTRAVGGFGVVAPPVAACAVLTGGWMTPGYDPFARTISRLAETGLPAAAIVELAICTVGVVLLALAVAMGPGSRGGRALLAIAGLGLLAAAAIRLDPEFSQGDHRTPTCNYRRLARAGWSAVRLRVIAQRAKRFGRLRTNFVRRWCSGAWSACRGTCAAADNVRRLGSLGALLPCAAHGVDGPAVRSSPQSKDD